MINKILTPTIFHKIYQKLYDRWLRYLNKGNSTDKYFCMGCKRHWKKYKPFPLSWQKTLIKCNWLFSIDQMETLSVNSYSCYGCGITDRDRLYILFLEQWIKKDKFYKILEFAPRQSLSNYIKNLPNVEHRTTDLFMKNVDDNLDIQNLHSYKNNNFDLVICSHVLEHVQNDKQAMSELYRILKPEGVGIVMVPLVIGNNAMIEDESITDSCLRIKYFGQADHVRLYSKKIFLERLQSVGFEVMQYNQSCFDSKEWSNAGLSSSSILYVVKKR